MGKKFDAELRHAIPHQALVGKEAAGLVADAGKTELLSDVGDRADRDVGLIRDHAADGALAGKLQNAFLVPDVDEQGVSDIWLEGVGDHRRCKQNVVRAGSPRSALR